MKYKVLFTVLFPYLISFNAHSTHIVGGDITAKWISGNDFEITLYFYRDCSEGSYIHDPQILLGVFDKSTNEKMDEVLMSLGRPKTKLKLGDACYSPPNLCVEEGVYKDTINLSDNPNGYYITWQRCCRNGIIQNIDAPGDAGIVFYLEIPDPAMHNSSPVFGNYPGSYMCLSQSNTSSFSCTDIDGDSLVYSLTTPLNGDAISSSPGQYPAATVTAGPYFTINWLPVSAKPYYSEANMIGGFPAMMIDSKTGVLAATPDVQGFFVFAVRVEEYRNGTKIGEVRRDVQYSVAPCGVNISSKFILPADSVFDLVGGDSLCFAVFLKDENDTDKVSIRASSDLFVASLNMPLASFMPAMGVKEVQSDFCLHSSCANVRDVPYIVKFLGQDSSCLGINKVIKTVYIKIIPEVDISPQFILPISSTFQLVAGDTLCFDVKVDDANLDDWLTLSATSELLPPDPNMPQIKFDSKKGVKSVQTAFCIIPSCANIRDEPYTVTFTGRDSSCFKNQVDLNVEIKIVSLFDGSISPDVPNIFTPNDDHINDVFKIDAYVNYCFDIYNIKIYNRWGRLVFESNDFFFAWNGTDKDGSTLPEGTYYYTLQGEFRNYVNKKQGFVKLLR